LPNIHPDRSKFISSPKTNSISRKRSAEIAILNGEGGKKKKSKREINAEEIALAKSDLPIKIDFDPKAKALKGQFNEKNCHEIERVYWRNLTFTQPMYGADMEGCKFRFHINSGIYTNRSSIYSIV
jgi:hypothetical protein